MREWAKELGKAVFRRRDTEVTQVAPVSFAQATTAVVEALGTASVEHWLEQKGQQLNRDWSLARLGGFSRGDDAATRQRAGAMLRPTEEVFLESALDELSSEPSIQVRTQEGSIVGTLEPYIAKEITQQMAEGELVRCFVYSVTVTESRIPSSILLAVMS